MVRRIAPALWSYTHISILTWTKLLLFSCRVSLTDYWSLLPHPHTDHSSGVLIRDQASAIFPLCGYLWCNHCPTFFLAIWPRSKKVFSLISQSLSVWSMYCMFLFLVPPETSHCPRKSFCMECIDCCIETDFFPWTNLSQTHTSSFTLHNSTWPL